MTPTQAAQWFDEFLTALSPEAWAAIRGAIQGQPSRVEVNGMEAAATLTRLAEGKPTGDPNVDAFFARKRGQAPPIQDPSIALVKAAEEAMARRQSEDKRKADFWDKWKPVLVDGYWWALGPRCAEWELLQVDSAYGVTWAVRFGEVGAVELTDFVDFVRVDIRPPKISVDAPPEP